MTDSLRFAFILLKFKKTSLNYDNLIPRNTFTCTLICKQKKLTYYLINCAFLLLFFLHRMFSWSLKKRYIYM